MPNPDFLHKKYRHLNTSPEVKSTVQKQRRLSGKPHELPPQLPDARIQAYLDRLKAILEPEPLHSADGREIVTAEHRKQRNVALLQSALYRQIVIKPDQVPNSYFQAIIQRHQEEGRPLDAITVDQRSKLIETLIADQKSSLDSWINYLTSTDAKYPNALKYWVFRSMLDMSAYNKEKQAFGKRTSGSVAPFPEFNQAALEMTLEAMEEKYNGEQINLGDGHNKTEMDQFYNAVRQENFPKIYAWLIEKFHPISQELLKITAGEWRLYPQGSEPERLVAELRDYGTGWCLRNKGTARLYLQGDADNDGDDLEIYFSNDETGQPRIPRVVIVSRAGTISKIHGIARHQYPDEYIAPIVTAKLAESPDGARFQKKVADMAQLAAINHKAKTNTSLNREDLIFLYEINSPIQWFGDDKDPRIEKLIAGRDAQADMLAIFQCQESEIAYDKTQVGKHTKAYIGPFYPGIFYQLAHLEHVYTQFPEKRIRRIALEIGGKTIQQLQTELETNNIQINQWTRGIINRIHVNKNPSTIHIISLHVSDLGFNMPTAIADVFAQAKEFGLEPCPVETGIHYRLQYMHQPDEEYCTIGSMPISVPNNRQTSALLRVSTTNNRPGLHAVMTNQLNPWDEIVFSIQD